MATRTVGMQLVAGNFQVKGYRFYIQSRYAFSWLARLNWLNLKIKSNFAQNGLFCRCRALMGDLLLARSKTLFDSLLPVFTPLQQMRYSMKLCHFDVMAIHLRPMQMVAKSFFSSVQRRFIHSEMQKRNFFSCQEDPVKARPPTANSWHDLFFVWCGV